VLYLRTADTHLFTLTPPAAPPGDPAVGAPAAEPAGEELAGEATRYGLYVQALAALRTDRYDEAISLLDSLLTLDPGYRDAAARRDAARRAHRLATDYQRARAAEDAGDWPTACTHYQQITEIDPGYRDVTARRDTCRRAQEIGSLQDELRLHASTGARAAVLAVSATKSADPLPRTSCVEMRAKAEDQGTDPRWRRRDHRAGVPALTSTIGWSRPCSR